MSGSLGLIAFTSDLIFILLKHQTLTNQKQSNLFINQIIPLTDSNGFSCRTSLVKRPCFSLLYGELRTRIDKHCNKTTTTRTSQVSQNTNLQILLCWLISLTPCSPKNKWFFTCYHEVNYFVHFVTITSPSKIDNIHLLFTLSIWVFVVAKVSAINACNKHLWSSWTIPLSLTEKDVKGRDDVEELCCSLNKNKVGKN